MVAAEGVVTVTYLCIAFANSPWLDSVLVTFLLFLVNMFAVGMFGPAAQAMILDLTVLEARKFVYSFIYWANNLAVSVGGIIGGFFFLTHRFELFLVLSAISLFSVLVTSFFLAETYRPVRISVENPQAPAKQAGIRYKAVFRDLLFRHFLWGSVLLLALENQLTNYIGVRLANELTSQPLFSWLPFMPQVDGLGMVGILRAENTLLVVIGGLVISKLLNRFNDSKLMLVGICLYTSGFMLLAVGRSTEWLIGAMLIVTLGELLYVPTKQALLGELTPSHARSSYMAVNNLAFYAAMIVAAAPVAAGTWISPAMMAVIYLAMGVMSLYWLGTIAATLQKRKTTIQSDQKKQASQ